MRGVSSHDPSFAAHQRGTVPPSAGSALPESPEGWDKLAAALRQPKPLTDHGWPGVAQQKYSAQHMAVVNRLATVTRPDSECTSIIAKCGKVFVGDFHHMPEGWVTLHFMLETLPVKKVYLESNGMGVVVQNSACMQWIREHPHATAVETFQKVLELCLSRPPVGVNRFLEAWTTEGGALHGLSPEQAADIYRRKIEVECSVARLVIEKGVVVENLFVDHDLAKVDGRSLSHDAWRSFKDTSTGLGVCLMGELHVITGSPLQPDLHDLLDRSDGVLARTPISFVRSTERAPYGRDHFRAVTALPQATLCSTTSVPGVSANDGDAHIKHQVLFALYTADPSAVAAVANTATVTTTTTTTDTTVTMTTTPTAKTTTGSLTRSPDAPANS